jgi:hypothetical protein
MLIEENGMRVTGHGNSRLPHSIDIRVGTAPDRVLCAMDWDLFLGFRWRAKLEIGNAFTTTGKFCNTSFFFNFLDHQL